jgi:ProP effector
MTKQNSALKSVTVTHKATRQYDPDAVARLKEKLGLSSKSGLQKETSD